MEAIVSNYKKYLEQSKLSANTQKAYAGDAKEFVGFCNNSEVNLEILNKYINYLTHIKLFSAKTITRKINSVRFFCDYLVTCDLIKDNFALKLQHPQSRKRSPKILSRDECTRLRNQSSESLELYCLIELILQTGLKISEVSELKLKDIRLNKAPYLITIPSGKLTRTIPLNNKIKFTLLTYINEVRKGARLSDPLFITSKGNRINVRNLRSEIDSAIMNSDLSGITVNDLRNTFIYYQLKAGMNIQRLSVYTGLTSLKSLERFISMIPEFRPSDKITTPVEV